MMDTIYYMRVDGYKLQGMMIEITPDQFSMLYTHYKNQYEQDRKKHEELRLADEFWKHEDKETYYVAAEGMNLISYDEHEEESVSTLNTFYIFKNGYTRITLVKSEVK